MRKKSAVPPRILFPATGFTTADLAGFYRRIAPVLLPHLSGRPVSLKRFPTDIHGESYWEKDLPEFAPPWVKTFGVPRANDPKYIHYINLANVKTLAWVAEMGCIEIHPFLHRYPQLEQPTMVVFDLDPGPGVNILQCCQVGLMLRELFRRESMQTFPKVSGSKGIQVYVPLNTETGYNITQPLARKIADLLCETAPQLIVSDMAKRNRKGKVLIDWSQNAFHKTTIAVYSVRAKREKPYVSLPVTWEEVEQAIATGDARSLDFDVNRALERVEHMGDLFAPVLKLKQHLPEELLRQWNIAVKPLPSWRTRRPPQAKLQRRWSMPRSSAQGGRRLFVVHRIRWANWHFEIAVQAGRRFLCWDLGEALPLTAEEVVSAQQSQEEELNYLTFQTNNNIVWDLGTYEILEGSFRNGSIRLFLSGRKLHGEWKLSRTDRNSPGNWVMVNSGGVFKPEDVGRDESAIASEAKPGDRLKVAQPARTPDHGHLDLRRLPEHAATFVQPMECAEVRSPGQLPDRRAQWLYELKWDGFRCLIVKRKNNVQVLTRRGNKPNARFEHIAAAIASSSLPDVVLDGELVALNANGVPEFQLLQNSKRNDATVVFAAFDVLNYGGRDLTAVSLESRKQFLMSLRSALPQDEVIISEPLEGEVQQIVELMRAEGLEGVVAKRRNSLYYPARDRFEGWVKYRITEVAEFVIGGYMPRHEPFFDALVVGRYEHGMLIYKEKVRFGYDRVKKESIVKMLKPLRIETSPFENLPQKKRRGALDAAQMRECVWVKPEIWCEMEFPEWTRTGEIRGHGKYRQLLDKRGRKTV